MEVYDRVDTATMTGRLCYPLSDLFLLQWEEQRRSYPKGRRHRDPAVNPQGDPLLLVTVGTDHHPFDRLVQWVDGWLATPGGCAAGLHCLMQTGTSVPPTGSAAGWQDYLEFEVLQAAMRDAAAVVCHGGPGTILGARHMGTVPIVVPRRRRLGEHVDDHQVAFSRRLAAEGSVFLAETEADLHRLLDRVATEPAAFRARFEHRGTATTVRAFERLVDDLVAGRPTPRQEIPDEVVR